jgi:hypothetical protein
LVTKRKRIIKKTYNEFLSWLEGVESMQEDGWVPNKIQWGKIREMLNHIKPEQTVPASKTTAAAQQPISPPGQPVARILNAQGVPESAFAPAPIPAPRAPQPPPRKIPSGVPNERESILNPGEAHPDNEFL